MNFIFYFYLPVLRLQVLSTLGVSSVSFPSPGEVRASPSFASPPLTAPNASYVMRQPATVSSFHFKPFIFTWTIIYNTIFNFLL